MLAYNSLFPLVPETYIADEMKGPDRQRGRPGLVHRSLVAVAGYGGGADLHRPRYRRQHFRSDVLVVFWAAFVAQRLDHLGAGRQALRPPGPLIRF